MPDSGGHGGHALFMPRTLFMLFPCLFEQVMTFDYLLKRPSEHLRLLNTSTLNSFYALDLANVLHVL
jgi:hypothetical protein